MTPVPYRVVDRREETADTVTLTLEPVGDRLPPWAPGQFTMVYAFGVGEIPISVSGGRHGLIRHTVRAVGAVSRAICARAGRLHPRRCGARSARLAGRRPTARTWWSWPAASAWPRCARSSRRRWPRPGPDRAVLIGARTPAELIFTDEYDGGARPAPGSLVDGRTGADAGWTGQVGRGHRAARTRAGSRRPTRSATSAGPRSMMRLAARALVDRGVRPDRVTRVAGAQHALRRRLCGHCQLGPLLVCRDGPVVGFDAAEPLLAMREL